FDDGAHEHLVVAVVRQVADEQAVDLEHVDLEVLEVGERGEAAAEIVQAQGAAGVPQRVDEALGVAQVGNGGRLGQLHQQPLRRHAPPGQLGGDEAGQVGIV